MTQPTDHSPPSPAAPQQPPVSGAPADPAPVNLDDPTAALPLSVQLLKVEADAFARAIGGTGWKVPAVLWAASGVAFGLGSGSIRTALLRVIGLAAWLFFAHVLAQRQGGKGRLQTLFVVGGLVLLPDVVASLGTVGVLAAGLATLWYAMVFAALLEREYQMGSGLALRVVLKGAALAFAMLVLLSVMDAGVRGAKKWERPDLPPGETQGRVVPPSLPNTLKTLLA